MTLSDVELGHHVHARAEPCLSVPGSRAYLPSSTARGRETLGAGSPSERAGIDQSQPRVCTTSGPFSPCSFPSAGSKMMQCFVCWEVTSLLHVRKQKKGAGRSRPSAIFMYQNRRKRRRAAVGGSAWAGSQGRRDQGSSTRSQAGGFVQAFVLPSQRRWLPISYTGRAPNGENRGGDGSKRGPMILSECHREVRKQKAKPVLVCVVGIWELSISRCPFLSILHGHSNAMRVEWKRPETEDAGNKDRQTCQTELA